MADTIPSTPPRRTVNLPSTPEHVKQIELNRLKAKAAQRQREYEASSSSHQNANNKRPLGATPAESTSPTAPATSKPLKRDSRLGKYFDYDLSKMVNSKGGFLVEEGKEVDLDRIRKEKERERQRAMQSLEPPMFLDPAMNPKCKECESMDIDQTFKKVFRCLVCKKCQNEIPEKYSLLTKTECKEDYLLTDPELRDQELLPHLLKANPHKSTYANMMLFLRYQVEEFAWKKWGSPEALDAEYERRVEEKKKKKNKKFEQSLKDLRKRTKEGVWQRRKDEEHKHVFSQVQRGPDGIGQQVCHSCGFTIDHEQISTSLEVEKIEVNLFRSKSLWLPLRARGVFGGQVISQALVSATNCVDPAYGLHSLHCYFLTSASPSTPIVYSVERLRQGRSYVTREVKAVQNGQIIFVMLCSFQKPEPWQPSHQWPMPNAPTPEACELDEVMYTKAIESGKIHPKLAEIYRAIVAERSRSPIAVKRAKEHHVTADGTVSYMFWMKARDVPKYETPFQKCILSYMSDLNFISSASRIMGLKRFGKGPDVISMHSTIDHSIYFYNDDFDCGDWILYVMICPRAGSGRGVVHGRMYTRDGTLVAVTSQEGVVRADVRGPEESKPAAKL
ncbi:thioesterase-like superfamily-domain-containing protein [Crucibulum laeve]|uniref:DNA repair protein RAD14 n=1 Tax=Crucibulum laeve TaxID=68775 RepID=A0A5C3MA58_9AGAR|nr:thioesterase-like superfamily-domain-containing protein [Crucibulum laeve]